MAQHNRLGHPLGRKITVIVVRLVIRLLLRLDVSGLDNLPPTGPVLIVINHIALLDPVLICAIFPRMVTPIAKKEAFDLFFFRALMNVYGTISVNRGEADIGAIKTALRVLRRDGLILLAPEGTRSPTYRLQEGKEGAVVLALRSSATILPVGVTGTHQIKSYWRRFRRAPVQLSIGKPFSLRSATGERHISRAERAAMLREMMYRLAAQLPNEYRGIYHNLEESTEEHLVPA